MQDRGSTPRASTIQPTQHATMKRSVFLRIISIAAAAAWALLPDKGNNDILMLTALALYNGRNIHHQGNH